MPWRVKDEREVTGRLISTVLRQATDCCYMTDRDKKKKKIGRSAEKEVLPMEKPKVMRFPLKCIFHEYLTAVGARL